MKTICLYFLCAFFVGKMAVDFGKAFLREENPRFWRSVGKLAWDFCLILIFLYAVQG